CVARALPAPGDTSNSLLVYLPFTRRLSAHPGRCNASQDMTTQSSRSSAPDVPSYADKLAEELEELAAIGEIGPDAAERFLDREASWLDYSARVLELAEDPDVPLLERVRFAAIFAGNLDEFFMVRVAGLRRRIATGIAVTTASGLSASEQLDLISRRAHEQV